MCWSYVGLDLEDGSLRRFFVSRSRYYFTTTEVKKFGRVAGNSKAVLITVRKTSKADGQASLDFIMKDS